jgi:ParB-like chromosome segregation protein Spo0J
MRFETVRPGDFALRTGDGALFSMRFACEPGEELRRSVAEHGIIEPVVAEKFGGGLRIIAGFMRIEAARAGGVKRIPAVVYPEDALTPRRAFALALAANSPGHSLGDADRAVTLRKARDDFGFDRNELIDVVAPAVGLPPSHKVVEQFLDIAALPGDVLGRLVNAAISKEHCLAATLLPAGERAWFFAEVVEPLRLSAGDARLVAVGAIDLACRAKTTTRNEVERLLAETPTEGPPKERRAAFKAALARRLAPVMTEMEDEFAALLGKLGAPSGISVTHGMNFETDEVRIGLAAKDIAAFTALGDMLQRGIDAGVFEEMLSIAARKSAELSRQTRKETSE